MSHHRSAAKRRKLRARRQLRHRVERLEAQVERLTTALAENTNPPQLLILSETAVRELIR